RPRQRDRDKRGTMSDAADRARRPVAPLSTAREDRFHARRIHHPSFLPPREGASRASLPWAARLGAAVPDPGGPVPALLLHPSEPGRTGGPSPGPAGGGARVDDPRGRAGPPRGLRAAGGAARRSNEDRRFRDRSLRGGPAVPHPLPDRPRS